jgi:hypothetical protein
MAERGLGSALKGWSALLGRGEFWFAALVFMSLDGLAGYLRGQAIADAGARASATRLGMLSMLFGLVGFLVAAAIQFALARRLGADDADVFPAAVGKWIALFLAYNLVITVIGAFVPILLVRSGADTMAFVYGMPAVQLAVAVALLPIAVRQVAAAHSGNRVRIGAVTGFLGNDAASWFGGRLLLGLGLSAVGRGVGMLAGLTGGTNVLMMVNGLYGGLFSALLMLWPIAAYRAMTVRQNFAETFS